MTRGNNCRASLPIKEDHELVTTGPCRFVRQPIYTALLGLYLATAIAPGTVAAFVGLHFVLTGCLVKLRQEEAFVVRRFPDQYSDDKSGLES